MPATDPKKLPGIFISYRRSDTPDAVGRIYDRLVSEFGKARVFKDVDSIPLGQDFRGHLNEIVGGCAAVLAIIGPRWIDTRNAAGQRRLEDPDDFVRIELEAALARSVPVVPVLVGHAPMPGTTDLPASLSSMAFRQSIEVRPDPDFHNDATRLVAALRVIIDPNAPRPETSSGVNARPRRFPGWMIAFAAATLVAAALAFPALKHLRETPPAEIRTEINTPATDLPTDFALSPDGRQIVFVARGDSASRLWLRSFATTTAQPLPGTEGATAPFWSPDGRSIGFFAAGALKRLDPGGSQPQTLAPAGNAAKGTWGTDGTILFARGPGDPLVHVDANGGAVTEVTRLGPQGVSHRAPQFLPDGRQFLFMSTPGFGNGVYLGALDGRTPIRLTTGGTFVAYMPSGWMLWQRAGALAAQRLDLQKAALTGETLTVANGVSAVSVSTTGLVAYRTVLTRQRQLTWVDRSGTARGTVGEPDETLGGPRVSPDGRRVALSREAQGNVDVWLLDGALASRMSFDASADTFPTWSPDGKRVVYKSSRSGNGDIYQKDSNGTGMEELLVSSDRVKFPSSWSADGRFLLYFTTGSNTRGDIWVLPMTGDRKPFVFLQTPFNEVWGQFSPDGRWVAYQSNESGRDEVYVRPFVQSSASVGQRQMSTAGGVQPTWRLDGKELYYINPAGEMMAVPIALTGPTLVPGAPVSLFPTQVLSGGVDIGLGRQYDVAPDGRFLINRELNAGETPPITLIQNWNPDAGQ